MEEVTAEEVKQYIQLRPEAVVECFVTKPEKVGDGINAYITYVVNSKRTDESTKSVTRRYSDFEWLREMLVSQWKHLIVPPLPGKVLFDRFNTENIEYRRKELERFMRRITNHPHFSTSNHLETFLTANETVMDVERSKPRVNTQQGSGAGGNAPPKKEEKSFFSTLSALTSAVAGPSVELKEIDPYFEVQKSYLVNLDHHLQNLVAKANANSKRKEEMISSLKDFSHAASLACGAEVGHDDAVADFWSKFSELLGQIASLTNELAHGEVEAFEDQIKDYVRLVGAAKDLLDTRNAALLKYQQLQADAHSKAEKQQKASSASKAAAFASDLQEANKAAEAANEDFKFMNEAAKQELQQFKDNKSTNLSTSMKDLVTLNLTHQLKVVQMWTDLLNDLEENKF